jgi:hypothetical protein
LPIPDTSCVASDVIPLQWTGSSPWSKRLVPHFVSRWGLAEGYINSEFESDRWDFWFQTLIETDGRRFREV